MKGADQCPKCASSKWADVDQGVTDFYTGALRVCGNCGTAWEPFEIEDLPHGLEEPLAAFKHPCNNCAFRKGSPEQRYRESWDSKMIEMSFGASFYCHKGVPVTPGEGHGFAYPEDKNGNPIRRKLRLCRGYLNSIVGPKLNELARREEPPASDEELEETPWTDEEIAQ